MGGFCPILARWGHLVKAGGALFIATVATYLPLTLAELTLVSSSRQTLVLLRWLFYYSAANYPSDVSDIRNNLERDF